MSERRSHRGPAARTDAQVLAHEDDMALLEAIASGRFVRTPADRWDLRRLARDGLLLAGFAVTAAPTLLPRGERLVAVRRGLLPAPVSE